MGGAKGIHHEAIGEPGEAVGKAPVVRGLPRLEPGVLEQDNLVPLSGDGSKRSGAGNTSDAVTTGKLHRASRGDLPPVARRRLGSGPFGLPRWLQNTTRPDARRTRIVGRAASRRKSSSTVPLLIGTLRSARTSTVRPE